MGKFNGGRALVVALLTGAAILPAAASAAATQGNFRQDTATDRTATPGRTIRFDIPASDLSQALRRFSRESGLQVIVAPGDANGRRSAALQGRFTVRQGLDRLLAGTGLAPHMNGQIALLKPVARRTSRAPAAASVPLSQSAQAPDNSEAPAPRPTIIVTGYRASITVAQDLKRRAVNAQDDILAQDIASFPDLNLAESLQRIPGITITRDSGEGRQIALRGLGPDFTRTQLNGMEVLGNTASGMDNRGGVSRTRAFDYSLFASELFNRITVQKSYSADQDEGGIAGTVQLFTSKPFDYQGSRFVVGATGQINDQAGGITPRFVALASKQWGDFGALVSVAYSQNKNNEYGYRNWGWHKVTYDAANIGSGIDAATASKLESGDVYAPEAESPSSWYTNRQRLGITTALQYHPSDRFQIDVDGLYGRMWDYRNDYALAVAGTNALTGSTISGTQVIQSATIDDHDSLVAADYTGVDLRSEHHIIREHTDFYQGVANLKWQPTDRLTIHALGGYEQSDYRQPVFDKVFMEDKDVAFGFDDTTRLPTNTYGSDLTDPDDWSVQRMDAAENGITSSYVNAKLGGTYDLGGSSKLEFGGSYKRFSNSGYSYSNKVFHNDPSDTDVPDDLKQTVGVDTITQYIVGDVDGIYSLIGDPRDLDASYEVAGSDYKVLEKTWSGYAQYDLDTYVMDLHLRANAGVRYYSTDLTSSGTLTTSDGYSEVSIPTNSHGWLPAVNVALDLTHSLVLRASANRNVSRPPLGDLAAAGTITTRPGGGSVSFGNPYLKPYKATSIEGSLEYYMGGKGFASLGVFYKKMDSFITSTTYEEPFADTGLPDSVLIEGEDDSTIFDVSQPINSKGASILGLEAAFQHDFDFLPGALRHLGVIANGTWFDGHQHAVINDVTYRLPLTDLSKWAANATLYYETKVWGMRVSDAYRSQYLTSTGSNGNVGDGIEGQNYVDFQAHVNLPDGVKVVFEGLNLTNTATVQFADIYAKRIEAYTTAGRTFTLGFTKQF